MTEPQPHTQNASQQQASEPCLCREVLKIFHVHFGISPEVHQHLRNSRIELLKAVRQAIDDRIEHLSKPAKQGTSIPVE